MAVIVFIEAGACFAVGAIAPADWLRLILPICF